jgi:two-component system LytT family response regulator
MRKALASTPASGTRVVSLTAYPGNTAGTSLRKTLPNNTPISEGRVAVSSAGKIDMVEIADILYLKAESNYVRIFAREQINYLMARTLKQVSSGLEQYGFIRIHQSFLVHPAMIRSYRTKESVVILRSGDELPVSRSNRKMVTQQLMKWS